MSEYFTPKNNFLDSIPDQVLTIVKSEVRGTHVLDYGSGQHPDMHIDFGVAHHTRVDLAGVIAKPSFAASFDVFEIIDAAPPDLLTSLVMFRSFSCFNDKTLTKLRETFTLARNRFSKIAVYDYAINLGKRNEYILEENALGRSHGKHAEWYEGVFYHYDPQQLSRFFNIRDFKTYEFPIPALKEQNSPGFLWIATLEQQ